MKHSVSTPNLGHGKAYRTHLLRNIAHSLITHGKIETTLAHAKAARSNLEKMITLAKSDTPLYERYRYLKSRFGINLESAKKLISDIAPAYVGRPGGYLRILRNGFNRSANPLAVIALV